MDKNVGKDVGRGKEGRQKKLTIQHWFWRGCFGTCFKKSLKLKRKKQNKLIKNPKGLRRSCNRVWIVGKEQQRDLQNLYKK
jgi:hypothetical protein